MRLRILACLLVLITCPLVLSAQQTILQTALTDTQQLGRRLYHRGCAVCHGPPLITSNAYAPVLYRGVIEGQEDATREIISKGLPAVMPGFRYGLKSTEIDAIVDYLKTVPKPSPSTQKGESDKRAD
jgi:mono/diheme cytochrome c family protein